MARRKFKVRNEPGLIRCTRVFLGSDLLYAQYNERSAANQEHNGQQLIQLGEVFEFCENGMRIECIASVFDETSKPTVCKDTNNSDSK
jgi:hypothetical protein